MTLRELRDYLQHLIYIENIPIDTNVFVLYDNEQLGTTNMVYEMGNRVIINTTILKDENNV